MKLSNEEAAEILNHWDIWTVQFEGNQKEHEAARMGAEALRLVEHIGQRKPEVLEWWTADYREHHSGEQNQLEAEKEKQCQTDN